MTSQQQQQTWLVTGSSKGMGLSIVSAALAAGHNVVATARNTNEPALASLVAKYPSTAKLLQLDVTNPEEAKGVVAAAVEAFGTLDVVVNNAGYANCHPIEDFDLADIRAQVETNLFGVVNVTKAALPVFRAQGRGHFFQISSIGGRTASPGLGPYQMSKWAVGGFSEVLQQEVRPLGIKVTIVEPSGFRTEWAGTSMKILEVSEPYKATVGVAAASLEARNGKQKGDPDRLAKILVDVALTADAPLHLLLGKDAVRIAKEVIATRTAEDAKWAAVGESADYQ